METLGINKMLNDYNCRHFKFPVIVGITPPKYSTEELAWLAELEKKEFGYGDTDKKYTLYELSQMLNNYERMMNKYERQIAYYEAKGERGKKGLEKVLDIHSKWFNRYLLLTERIEAIVNEHLSLMPKQKPESENSKSLYYLSSDGAILLAELEYGNSQRFVYKNGIREIPMHMVGDGKYTYGFGHAVDSTANAPIQADADGWMSVEDAYKLLAENSVKYVNEVKRILAQPKGGDLSGLQLKQNEIDALVIICYNRPAAIYAVKTELSKDRNDWDYDLFFTAIINDYPDNPRFIEGWKNRTRATLDLFFSD